MNVFHLPYEEYKEASWYPERFRLLGVFRRLIDRVQEKKRKPTDGVADTMRKEGLPQAKVLC